MTRTTICWKGRGSGQGGLEWGSCWLYIKTYSILTNWLFQVASTLVNNYFNHFVVVVGYGIARDKIFVSVIISIILVSLRSYAYSFY